MSVDEILQEKIYRLDELKKYQSYYGPNTPYPVIVEINELEAEIRQLLQNNTTRPTKAVKKKKKRSTVPFWRMSQATFDMIATISFIGLLFLLGTIVFAAYVRTRPTYANTEAVTVMAQAPVAPVATLRPTFTPTADPNAPDMPVTEAALVESVALPPANQPATAIPTSVIGSLLPAYQEATSVPTTVATLTPTFTPVATEASLPTGTPAPTNTPRPLPTATPVPPTPIPPSSYPFKVAEQGNREFQKTNYHAATIYVAILNGTLPLGGLKVVGDHVPSGKHVESGYSNWHWSVVNCLSCDYVKQGNLKFEPGPFTDGVWNVYVSDDSGAQLSPVVSLAYSADPAQWVWDFIIFSK